MPDSVVNFAFVIEGEGEVAAMPLLVRRICHELLGVFAVRTARPVRVTKAKLIRSGELERAIRLARSTNPAHGPVLVVLDADDDCPALLGPSLKSRTQSGDTAIVIPKYEFETWFLTAAASLAGRRGLREGLVPRPDPEMVRGAKEWLTRNMVPGRTYSPAIDQAALVAGMDLNIARSCRSFERLCREIERLVASR
ncbi:MAG: DUF4276 family protein [Bryobacteraceae bacterium]